MFLTQGGPKLWSHVAELLIACRNARLAFQDDYSTLRVGLGIFLMMRMGRINQPTKTHLQFRLFDLLPYFLEHIEFFVVLDYALL
jgi:hypothetical protein